MAATQTFATEAAKLGLALHATPPDLAKTFRQRSLAAHPDKHGKGSESFLEMAAARDFLLTSMRVQNLASILLNQATVSAHADVKVFYMGNPNAFIDESDVVLGDSGVRTSSNKNACHIQDELFSSWSRSTSRGEACILICVGGGPLSDLVEFLRFVAKAKSLLLRWNGNEYNKAKSVPPAVYQAVTSLCCVSSRATP